MPDQQELAAEEILGGVPEDKQFVCSNRPILKNLEELKTALLRMDKDTFHSHCPESRNDFANID